MELNFDKEMDALLRQTARSGDFVSNQTAAHLDADEISAFAENALPEKTKQKYVLHLADCDKCRKNLSNVIALNTAQESEIIHAEKTEIVSSAIPWYQKLFAVPNLAYAMGGLVLVFSGIAAYTLLQNAGNLQNSEVSQVYEKQPNDKGMSSDGDGGAVSETYSSNRMMSNSASMNSASMNSVSNASASPAMPSAPTMSANSNAVMREKSDKDARDESKSERLSEPNQLAETQDSVVSGALPPPPPKENEYSPERQTQNQAQNQTQNQQNSGSQNQTQIMPDSRSVQSAPKLSARTQDKNKSIEESRDDARKKSVATTTVGGKTFKRADNVWYDSAYRGQSTINVTRGTNEYKKLDSKLRGIVENLGGTVVIVWRAKAYRIQ